MLIRYLGYYEILWKTSTRQHIVNGGWANDPPATFRTGVRRVSKELERKRLPIPKKVIKLFFYATTKCRVTLLRYGTTQDFHEYKEQPIPLVKGVQLLCLCDPYPERRNLYTYALVPYKDTCVVWPTKGPINGSYGFFAFTPETLTLQAICMFNLSKFFETFLYWNKIICSEYCRTLPTLVYKFACSPLQREIFRFNLLGMNFECCSYSHDWAAHLSPLTAHDPTANRIMRRLRNRRDKYKVDYRYEIFSPAYKSRQRFRKSIPRRLYRLVYYAYTI